MAHLPTMRVIHGKGIRVINKADFDPAVHEEYQPDPKPPAKPKAAAKPKATPKRRPPKKAD